MSDRPRDDASPFWFSVGKAFRSILVACAVVAYVAACALMLEAMR